MVFERSKNAEDMSALAVFFIAIGTGVWIHLRGWMVCLDGTEQLRRRPKRTTDEL